MDLDEYVKDQNARYLQLIEKHCSKCPGEKKFKLLSKECLVKVYTPDESGKPTRHTMTVEIFPFDAPLVHHVNDKDIVPLAEIISNGLRGMKEFGGLGVPADMKEHPTPRTLPGYENRKAHSVKRE